MLIYPAIIDGIGRPVAGKMSPKALEYFEARVERVTESGCWIWMGEQLPSGYGRMNHVRKTARALAHRVSYEHFRGPIPAGLQLDHLCRVRICCNPWHLDAVTPQVNFLRGMAPSAVAWRTARCQAGHALVGENVSLYQMVSGRQGRRCRTCQRRRMAKFKSVPGNHERLKEYWRERCRRRKAERRAACRG